MYELQSLEIYQHYNFPFQNPWRFIDQCKQLYARKGTNI